MSDDTKKMKARVLNALGMSEEAEVSALKSQVDELDEKIDGLITIESNPKKRLEKIKMIVYIILLILL